MRSTKRNWAFKVRKWVLLGLSLSVPVFACSVPLLCQQTPVVAELGTNPVMLQETASPTVGQKADGQTPGNIRGRVVDQSGANITGAIVTLTREGQSSSHVGCCHSSDGSAGRTPAGRTGRAADRGPREAACVRLRSEFLC